MIDGSMAALAAHYYTAGAAQAVTTAPTAAQIERFQDQLQQPEQSEVAHYEAPLPAAEAAQGHFTHLLDYASQVSDKLRVELERPEKRIIDPTWAPELQLMQEMYREMRGASALELQFQLMAKGMQMAARNVQLLYQQQG